MFSKQHLRTTLNKYIEKSDNSRTDDLSIIWIMNNKSELQCSSNKVSWLRLIYQYFLFLVEQLIDDNVNMIANMGLYGAF
jgi:hypothetical protein